MNGQNSPNTSNVQGFVTPTQLFYLDIEPHPNVTRLDSQAIPLNRLGSPNDHFILPIVKNKSDREQICVYIEPGTVEGSSIVNYINSHNFYSADGNTSGHNHVKTKVSTSTPGNLKDSVASETVNGDIVSKDLTSSSTNRENEKKHRQIKGFVPVLDSVAPVRAIAVLPSVLHIRRDCISPRRSLPQRVRFGPIQGVNHTISRSAAQEMVLKAAKCKEPIFLLHNNDNTIIHIDVSDKDKCNWLGLLPLGTQQSANVWLYEEGNQLYGLTTQSITAGTPLALGYTKPYVQEHGFPQEQPVLDMKDLIEEPRQWWCHECQKSFSTSSLLVRHVNQCHTDDITVHRRRYWCRHCTRAFTRLFALKRHIARYCNKRAEKLAPSKSSTNTTPAEDPPNSPLNIEDNRLPSDESLQNYTNGLDFSTSLFDTDRIPGLDISGSSRSETEFNPYSISYRDENLLTPELSFNKLSNDLRKSQDAPIETKEVTPTQSLLISCRYCKQTIIRKKKREHFSECPEKRLECECGRTFVNSEKLAKHIHAVHSNTTEPNTEPVQSNTLEYKCQKCQLSFKRRGMLVNHLWRVHESRAAVPLERRVRHYPCAACPKLYRTAAKRDTHQAVHHPGVITTGGRYAIEGGRRAVAPAACGACPRQYATRAKLLQHVRQRHPELAPPVKQPSKSTSTRKNDPTMPDG